MEDRDTGAGAPEAGASGAFPLPSNGAEVPLAGRGAVSAPAGDDSGSHPKTKGKRRRKRRRGRKVFARDDGGPPRANRLAEANPRPVLSTAAWQHAGRELRRRRAEPARAAPAPALRPAGFRRTRPRHQQLPPAGGGARSAGPVPRHRRVLAHRPAGRGAGCERTLVRSGDGPRRRGAEGLRRQAAQPFDRARAADRDRGLPFRRERRRVPCSG